MKYGIIQYDGDHTELFSHTIRNIGDAAQMIAIENIYKQMGIDLKDVIYIDYYDMETYSGEYVLVPVNLLITRDPGNKSFLNFSQKIIPVFLGVSFGNFSLGEQQLEALRNYQPIGCRDQRSMELLRKHGIEAYVNGCLALTLPSRVPSEKGQDKIVFVDVPKGVLQYIPDDIKKDIVFVDQELVGSADVFGDKTLKEYTHQIIDYYAREAKMIVTSRFHGAVIAMALGIPLIVTLERYHYRFNWIRKYIPTFYTEDNFSEINWNPETIDLTDIKKRMLDIAIQRIQEAYKRNDLIYVQSEAMESIHQADDFEQEVHCYADALSFIDNKWNRTDNFSYAIWGINDNAEQIYQHITNNYPNAQLRHAYDMYRTIDFHGVTTEFPQSFDKSDFIFVAPYIASQTAPHYFKEHGVSPDRYFLCKRAFIGESDLSE